MVMAMVSGLLAGLFMNEPLKLKNEKIILTMNIPWFVDNPSAVFLVRESDRRQVEYVP